MSALSEIQLLWTKLLLALGIESQDDSDDATDTASPVADAPIDTADSQALAARLQLPAKFASYIDFIAVAAINNCPQSVTLSAYNFALIIAAVMDRESGAGLELNPQIPGGVGDPTSRWQNSIPSWATGAFSDSVTGQTRQNQLSGGSIQTQYLIQAPMAFGAQARGWGYGLMQLDFASYYQSAAFQSSWSDPGWNINAGAEKLGGNIDSLSDIGAGIAAYNCGLAGARKAIAAGLDPDSKTTGGNYSADVLARARANGAGV